MAVGDGDGDGGGNRWRRGGVLWGGGEKDKVRKRQKSEMSMVG